MILLVQYIAEALAEYKKVLAIRQKIFGSEHSSIAFTYHNIAYIYYRQGDYDNALIWYEKTLELKEQYRKFDKALDLFFDAYRVRLDKLGDDNSETKDTYYCMEITYNEISSMGVTFEDWLSANLFTRLK